VSTVDERVPAWTLWPLRLLVLVVTVLLIVQPMLAGLFVTGDVGMLRMHSIVAGFVTLGLFLQMLAAILLWRPGRGAAWPIWASLALVVASEAQQAAGYARAIALHIPLGVLLFGLAVALLIGTWSPKTARRRRGAMASGTGRRGGTAAGKGRRAGVAGGRA